MKTIEELDTYFHENKINISIFHGPKYNFSCPCAWVIAGDKADGDIAIEVRTKDISLHAALYDLYEKFEGVVRRGAPNLLAPQLEHRHMTEDEFIAALDANLPKAHDDDEIPF